jgi:hypothetical protein
MKKWHCVLAIAAIALGACGGDKNGGTSGGGGTGGSGGAMCGGDFPIAFGMGMACVAAPSQAAQRSACGDESGITDYCATDGSTAPVLGCLPPSLASPSGARATVTGFVKVFSNGGNADGIRLEVFRAAQITSIESLASAAPAGSIATVLSQADVDARNVRACPTKDVPDHPPCRIPTNDCAVPCQSALDSTAGEYCSDGVCLQRQRYEAHYEIPDIEVDVPLVVRTGGPMGNGDPRWAPLVAFNAIVSSADPMCVEENDVDCWEDAGHTRYRYFPSALSRNDYQIIPPAAGLSSGIPAGKGAVAGEVRDCGNVRIEFAQVGISPPPTHFTYFNDNPFKTLPNLGRMNMGTDGLGLFTGLNITPGPVVVQAVGDVNGATTDLGSARVIVFPDTVTTVLINGGRPIGS